MARKYRHHNVCKSSAKVTGNHVTVKATCPIKAKKIASPVKQPKKTKAVKHTEVPSPCKGLRKIARKKCAKKVCAQRPKEYRKKCLHDAGIRG